ncbi:MAG: dephospho-CoA kinase [Mycoplasmatales bacterium]
MEHIFVLTVKKMIIAIKGYTGSGKTTFSKIIAEQYGADVFECDKYVHYLYQTVDEVITKVNQALSLVNDDLTISSAPEIDMQLLKKTVKDKPDFLLELERIVYPYVEAKINELARQVERLYLDCPIVDKLAIKYDQCIWISSSSESSIERVYTRDKREREQTKKFLEIQEKIIVKDKDCLEILNNETLAAFEVKIKEIMEQDDWNW